MRELDARTVRYVGDQFRDSEYEFSANSAKNRLYRSKAKFDKNVSDISSCTPRLILTYFTDGTEHPKTTDVFKRRSVLYKYCIPEKAIVENVTPKNMIIDRCEPADDYHIPKGDFSFNFCPLRNVIRLYYTKHLHLACDMWLFQLACYFFYFFIYCFFFYFLFIYLFILELP